MLTRAERKAKLKALSDARAKKAARQAGSKSPGSTPRHMAPGGQRFDARAAPPAASPQRLLEAEPASTLATPKASVASRPPTPRRLSKQLDQLREKKEAAARAQQLRDAAAMRDAPGGPPSEGTPRRQPAARTAAHRIAFSAEPPQEVVAELSPRTIRRERGVPEGPAAAPRVLKPLSDDVRAALAAAASEDAAQVAAPHPLLDALHGACSQGDVATIELLVQRGASVTDKDSIMGWCAIHYACSQPAAIAAVLRLGGDANAEDDYHMTALHLAAENGSYEAVRMLSKLNRRRRGSIEYLASKKGHYEICELLQKRWSGAPDSDEEEGAAETWKVECVYEFVPQESGDLGMTVGDIVVLTEALAEKKWWVGYHESDPQRRLGEFPSNYVRVLPAAPAAAPAATTQQVAAGTAAAAPTAPAASGGGGLRVVSEEELAATKVQSLYRGHRVRQRRRVAGQRMLVEDSAATRIQSTWRGRQSRRRMPPPLPRKKALPPPPLPAAPGNARESAPPLPPHQAHADSFVAKAGAWDELRYSPTHDSPRTSSSGGSPSPSPPPPPTGGVHGVGAMGDGRTNSAVARARDDEEARVREAMAALDELERTRSGVSGHTGGTEEEEGDPAAKRRLFLMAGSEPGESPVFLSKGGGGPASSSSPSSNTRSLSPTASPSSPQQLGVAMAAARGRHAALEALIEEQAAVAIQAAVRGRQARRRLPPALSTAPRSRSPSPRFAHGGASPRSPISPTSPGREARAAASMQLEAALTSLSAAEARAASLEAQLSRAESALAAQTSAVERDDSVREETKAQLQAALAARMGERAGVNGSRRLLHIVVKSWRARVAERSAEERRRLEEGFVELERSVVAYRQEAAGRVDAAEATHAKMLSRLAELEAQAAAAKEAEATAQAELVSVHEKASQLGAAMQSRVVAAEAETEECRSELQAAMREQEARHAHRTENLQAEVDELRGELGDLGTVQAEVSALRGVDAALKEAVARETELRARHAMLESTQEERSRRSEAVRKAEKLEQQKSLASQLSLEAVVAEREEELAKVSQEFKSYMTARYLLTIRRMTSCKVAAALHGWREAQLRAARARGTMTRAVARLQHRCIARCYEHWASLANLGGKSRTARIRIVSGMLKVQQQRLCLRTLAQWARQAKTIK
jgi:hypothetical protein